MPKSENDKKEILRGYGQALLAVARCEGLLDQVELELTGLRDAFTRNSDLAEFMRDAKVTSEGKRKAISEIMGEETSPLTRAQLGFAIDQGRGAYLPGIIDSFFALSAESRKKLTAKVVTAIPVSDRTKQIIEQTLSELVGEPVFLKTSVDPGLLGGITIHLGERIIDGSLKGQLDQLMKGLSRKILTEKGEVS